MTTIATPVSVEEAVGALASELEALVGSMEVAALSPRKAGALVGVFSKVANLAEVGRARCARRATVGLVHLEQGFRSPAAWLAGVAGGSVGEAIGALSSAEAEEQLPGLAEALSSGEVSLQKAAVIGAAAREEAGAERELVEAARREDLKTLKSRVEERRAAREREQDVEARHEALRRRRYLRTWKGADGACRGEFSLAPADAAPLLARLEAGRERRFEEARRNGEREPFEAYYADALCDLASGPGWERGGSAGDPGSRTPAGSDGESSGPKTRVLLRVDLPALLRGQREGDEVCEIAGVGPVPLAEARRLLGDGIVDLVLRRGVEVASVTSLGRTIPRAVRVALMDRDPACVVPGCTATQRLEIDHWRVDFARGGPTSIDNLARLCSFHHRMKTHRGWRLTGGPGRWGWVGPEEEAAGDPGPALEGWLERAGPDG